MNKPLGKFIPVDLRTIWKNEEYDFSTWLSQQDNLALLSDAIGVEIRLIQTEALVGKFSTDILAEEEGTGRKIVIENQLETTNHDHLGKIITYGAGHDADIVIWIFKEIREEHRQAINWLNENTNEDLAFFAVKLEAWQINDSPPAPKFQVISKPNEWAKVLKQGGGEKELTDTKLKQFEFWTQLKNYSQEKKLPIKFQTPRYQHWYNISIGISGTHIALTTDTKKELLTCQIYINDDKELFDFFHQNKDQIEKELGSLEWQREIGKACRIAKKFEGAQIDNEVKLPEYFEWLTNEIIKFNKVFGKLVKEYKQ